KGGDEVSESEGESDDEETRQEEEGSFDPIPRTPKGSEEESDDEEDQELRLTSTPSETATRGAGRSTIGSQSRQLSASESAFTDEPVQTTCQMEEPPHPVFETGVDDQPIVQTSQHPEWFSQPRRLPSPDRDWNKTLPAA
nr:hypothetical protein [Tanacetum cinerariifolium]